MLPANSVHRERCIKILLGALARVEFNDKHATISSTHLLCARILCKSFCQYHKIKFDSIGDYVEPPSYVYHKTQQPETITSRYIRRWRTLSVAHASLGARRKESFSKAVSELHSGGESCVRVVQSFWFLLWLEFRTGKERTPRHAQQLICFHVNISWYNCRQRGATLTDAESQSWGGG